MRTIAALQSSVLAIFVGVGAAFSQVADLTDLSCQTLVAEMEQHRSRHEPVLISETIFWLIPPNPVTDVLNDAMTGLDDEAFLRIKTPLNEALWVGCSNPELADLPADASVFEVLEFAAKHFELDFSEPRWGVVDLPTLDFSTQSFTDIALVLESLPEGSAQNPVNDIVRVAMTKYLSKFDLVTPEDYEKAQSLGILSSYEEFTDEPYKDTLDRLAKELGLKRKH